MLKVRRADITDEDVVRTTFNEIKNQFGPVTGLVNAAGIGLGGPFLQCTVQDMEAIWRVNVRQFRASLKRMQLIFLI